MQEDHMDTQNEDRLQIVLFPFRHNKPPSVIIIFIWKHKIKTSRFKFFTTSNQNSKTKNTNHKEAANLINPVNLIQSSDKLKKGSPLMETKWMRESVENTFGMYPVVLQLLCYPDATPNPLLD